MGDQQRPGGGPGGWALEANAIVLAYALDGNEQATSEACRRGSGPQLVRLLREHLVPPVDAGTPQPPSDERTFRDAEGHPLHGADLDDALRGVPAPSVPPADERRAGWRDASPDEWDRAWQAWTASKAAAPVEQERRDGVALIAAERKRQVEAEGWIPDHDDEHGDGSLAMAAASYAIEGVGRNPLTAGGFALWPWAESWWKPSPDPIRNLVRAGALVAAELDRLLRPAAVPGSPDTEGGIDAAHADRDRGDLEELRALSDKATPGEWTADNFDLWVGSRGVGITRFSSDAPLIAAAVNYVRALLSPGGEA